MQKSMTGSDDLEKEATANTPVVGRCYGCASSATEHCLTLLRALATNVAAREVLCKQGLIQELVEHNLRRGTILVIFLQIITYKLTNKQYNFNLLFRL